MISKRKVYLQIGVETMKPQNTKNVKDSSHEVPSRLQPLDSEHFANSDDLTNSSTPKLDWLHVSQCSSKFGIMVIDLFDGTFELFTSFKVSAKKIIVTNQVELDAAVKELSGDVEAKENVVSLFPDLDTEENQATYRIAKSANDLNTDCLTARGLTWTHQTIDKAYTAYKKLFPECVIVKGGAAC